jgi:putative peptidoglycan lipid II flippase
MSINFDKSTPDGVRACLDDAEHAGPDRLSDSSGAPSHAGENVRMMRAAGVVGGATLLSRILGAVRDIVIASFFGAGLTSDAFIAAFRIPNLLRRLLGEGTLSIAFVPVYTDVLYHQGRTEADRMATSAMRLLALVLLGCALFGIVAAPWLVRLFAPGFAESADKFELTASLTRIMFPYVIFVGLLALCMGILNVLGHFAAPALAPVFLNIAMIAALCLGARWSGDQNVQVRWLAFGVILGGVLQLGLQIPVLVRSRFRFWKQAPLWHPSFQRILLMLGPVLLGAAVYQINSLVVTLLASLLPQGSVSYLYYADRLVQFPLGIFGIATATAILPTLARQAASQQCEAMRQTFAHAITLVFFITLPSMVGLIVLREPIVALLFQRGAFDAHSMRLTASALLYYCTGLWAFSAIRIVLNVFYALKDARTPLRISLIAIAANLILGVLLMGPMQHNGLALALSLSSVFNMGLLTVALRRKLGALGWRAICTSIVKTALCAALMGVCVEAVSGWLLPSGGGSGLHLLPGVAGCALIGALVFAGLAHALKLPEMRKLLDIVRKNTPATPA